MTLTLQFSDFETKACMQTTTDTSFDDSERVLRPPKAYNKRRQASEMSGKANPHYGVIKVKRELQRVMMRTLPCA